MGYAMWFGLVLYFFSIFGSSFATQVSTRQVILAAKNSTNLVMNFSQVWQLIMLQGVLFGIAGGLLYVPVIKLLPEWFSERRGLAGGIIFAGGGVGGTCFSVALLQRPETNV